MLRSPVNIVAALALTTVVLSGCSGSVSIGSSSQPLSGEKVAEALRAEYAARERDSGITLVALTCQEVDAEAGATISCAGRNSKEIDVELGGEITATDSEGVDYRWRVARAFAPAALFERPLRPQIERTIGGPVRDVGCPVRVEIRDGGSFRCTVELTDRAPIDVDVRQTDGNGSFTWRLRRDQGGAAR